MQNYKMHGIFCNFANIKFLRMKLPKIHVSRAGITAGAMVLLMAACSSGNARQGDTVTVQDMAAVPPAFDRDSAYSFVEQLMAFGPRVPNTEAHRKSGDWLSGKLKNFGWKVEEQNAVLTAFDGTPLHARNIMASINPEKSGRLLLLAHWDCRPWADQDPDPEKRNRPVPGANDGASGIGVLLEIARQLNLTESGAPVDILFVDAEDWGSDNVEDSWALGTRYFTENPPSPGYRPSEAILLDMVGSPDARFGFEYFSQQSNPSLLQKVWSKAGALGHGKYFHTGFGGAVTDDHVQLISHGIPAIDIIDYRNSDGYQGFDPVWHTTADDMRNISRETLGAVGETVLGEIQDR